MKGQIFSIDVVIALAILTIAIGITIETLDLLQKRMGEFDASVSNIPDAGFAYEFSNFPFSGLVQANPLYCTSASVYNCWTMSNGSNAGAQSCSNMSYIFEPARCGNAYATTRLRVCAGPSGARYPCAITLWRN